jgi:hypothetical protein
VANCLQYLAKHSPELTLIVERWDTLPEPIRAAILAMINVSRPGK